jgi:DnaJ homolog subfamily C member 28
VLYVLHERGPIQGSFYVKYLVNYYLQILGFQKCFTVLGVEEYSDQNTIRSAYIKLVKKVHPDSGHPEASAEKFHEIDSAFRVLQTRFAKLRRGIEDNLQEEVNIFDIKHTAPQHRQYLSNIV